LRVVDLSRILGGPFCTKILGDHGAEVIKVEPPAGDDTRGWGPPLEREPDGTPITSAYYHGINWNKRGIALDLGRPEGIAILTRLLERADVLVENFKAGTLGRWGLDDATLRERFPRLVHCRVSGFGADGPLGGLPGYDAVAQAMSGLLGTNGSPLSGPIKVGVPVVDLVCGLHAAVGILAALSERERSGRGQLVEATLFDAGVSILHPHSSNWFAERTPVTLRGNAHPNIVPYDLFATRTRSVYLGVGNDAQFRKACEVLGDPALGRDPRYATNTLRVERRVELTAALTRLFEATEGDAICRELLDVGVPAGVVNEVGEVLQHPHTRHRGLVVEREGHLGPGPAVHMDRTPPATTRRPPRFGEHARQILEEAGYDDGEIDTLVEAGVVVGTPR
jgi:formyl-CoA transferase